MWGAHPPPRPPAAPPSSAAQTARTAVTRVLGRGRLSGPAPARTVPPPRHRLLLQRTGARGRTRGLILARSAGRTGRRSPPSDPAQRGTGEGHHGAADLTAAGGPGPDAARVREAAAGLGVSGSCVPLGLGTERPRGRAAGPGLRDRAWAAWAGPREPEALAHPGGPTPGRGAASTAVPRPSPPDPPTQGPCWGRARRARRAPFFQVNWKAGICFYWCFSFRVSLWKNTFWCIPDTTVMAER